MMRMFSQQQKPKPSLGLNIAFTSVPAFELQGAHPTRVHKIVDNVLHCLVDLGNTVVRRLVKMDGCLFFDGKMGEEHQRRASIAQKYLEILLLGNAAECFLFNFVRADEKSQAVFAEITVVDTPDDVITDYRIVTQQPETFSAQRAVDIVEEWRHVAKRLVRLGLAIGPNSSPEEALAIPLTPKQEEILTTVAFASNPPEIVRVVATDELGNVFDYALAGPPTATDLDTFQISKKRKQSETASEVRRLLEMNSKISPFLREHTKIVGATLPWILNHGTDLVPSKRARTVVQPVCQDVRKRLLTCVAANEPWVPLIQLNDEGLLTEAKNDPRTCAETLATFSSKVGVTLFDTFHQVARRHRKVFDFTAETLTPLPLSPANVVEFSSDPVGWEWFTPNKILHGFSKPGYGLALVSSTKVVILPFNVVMTIHGKPMYTCFAHGFPVYLFESGVKIIKVGCMTKPTSFPKKHVPPFSISDPVEGVVYASDGSTLEPVTGERLLFAIHGKVPMCKGPAPWSSERQETYRAPEVEQIGGRANFVRRAPSVDERCTACSLGESVTHVATEIVDFLEVESDDLGPNFSLCDLDEDRSEKRILYSIFTRGLPQHLLTHFEDYVQSELKCCAKCGQQQRSLACVNENEKDFSGRVIFRFHLFVHSVERLPSKSKRCSLKEKLLSGMSGHKITEKEDEMINQGIDAMIAFAQLFYTKAMDEVQLIGIDCGEIHQ